MWDEVTHWQQQQEQEESFWVEMSGSCMVCDAALTGLGTAELSSDSKMMENVEVCVCLGRREETWFDTPMEKMLHNVWSHGEESPVTGLGQWLATC